MNIAGDAGKADWCKLIINTNLKGHIKVENMEINVKPGRSSSFFQLV